MCTGVIFNVSRTHVSPLVQFRSSHHFSRNREEIMGAGSTATGSTADEEPGWEYHVGSMGRRVVQPVLRRFIFQQFLPQSSSRTIFPFADGRMVQAGN